MFERKQLAALIDTAVDGILSITADGTVSLYNKASERIFGYAPEEVIGRDIAMLMPTDMARHHGQYIRNYMETGHAKIIGIGREVEGRRKDGSIFPMDLSVGEFSEGEERFFVGIVRDLSFERAEQEKARMLQEQLELIGRHSAVSEMGAALAHELNQPLTAIGLFLVAAERQLGKDPERVRELFGRVRSEAERAGDIVRRIRQMVERSDGDVAAFPISEVVISAVELCRVVDRRRRTVEVAPLPEALVHGDETQVRMIVVNLIKNALDALEDDPEGRILVRVSGDDPVVVEVLDNGPGIKPEVAERLFEPFTTTKAQGLGIGLSICRTIAETHGGRLVYVPPRQQPNGLGGACFRLELPQTERIASS